MLRPVVDLAGQIGPIEEGVLHHEDLGTCVAEAVVQLARVIIEC